MTGRLVKTLAEEIFEKGENDIIWNVLFENSVIYFLRIKAEQYSETKKLSVFK
jgi:hypothetical protein